MEHRLGTNVLNNGNVLSLQYRKSIYKHNLDYGVVAMATLNIETTSSVIATRGTPYNYYVDNSLIGMFYVRDVVKSGDTYKVTLYDAAINMSAETRAEKEADDTGFWQYRNDNSLVKGTYGSTVIANLTNADYYFCDVGLIQTSGYYSLNVQMPELHSLYLGAKFTVDGYTGYVQEISWDIDTYTIASYTADDDYVPSQIEQVQTTVQQLGQKITSLTIEPGKIEAIVKRQLSVFSETLPYEYEESPWDTDTDTFNEGTGAPTTETQTDKPYVDIDTGNWYVYKDGAWSTAMDNPPEYVIIDFYKTGDLWSKTEEVLNPEGESYDPKQYGLQYYTCTASGSYLTDDRSVTWTATQDKHLIQQDTRITQTETAITLKADQSEVDALTGEVDDLSGEIDVQAGKIGLVVEETSGGNVIKSASIVAAINDDASSVKISADHITLSGAAVFEAYKEEAPNTIISASLKYAQNDSKTEHPASDSPDWQDEQPEELEGYYTWKWSQTVTAENVTYNTFECISAKDGEQGPEGPEGPQGIQGPEGPEGPQGPQGVSIVSVERQYATGTVDGPTGTWSTAMPEISKNYLIWSRQWVTYSNGQQLPTTASIESSARQISDWCMENNETYIDGSNIYTGTVTADQIAANAITTDKLNANAVTAGKIASGAITTDKLQANAVTAAKIDATDLNVHRVSLQTGDSDNTAAIDLNYNNRQVWCKVTAGGIGMEGSFGGITGGQSTLTPWGLQVQRIALTLIEQPQNPVDGQIWFEIV